MKFFRIFGVFLLVFILSVSFAFADSDDVENTNGPTEYTQQEVDTTILRVSANNSTGFQRVILGLLGDYNSIVKDYTYITTSYNGTQTTNHVVEITPDYSWICSACIFAICIYSIFRIIGITLGGIRK